MISVWIRSERLYLILAAILLITAVTGCSSHGPMAPTANSQNISTNVNIALPITLTGTPGTPGDMITAYTIVASPSRGALSGTIPNVTYTPPAGYVGSDSLTFKVTENNGLVSKVATVLITVVQPAPLILYTDLLSGPTSGGENNNGTYLSIFGKYFGASSGLGTTTKVFIGGVEITSYRYLGASLGRPDIQQITVQVGALTGLTPGTAYAINVQVNGVNSTSYTTQTFTPNPGHILFVSLTGDDSTAVVDDITHPWGDIQASTWASDPATQTSAYGAWGGANPGDVIVFRGGTYTMHGYTNGGHHTHFCQFRGGPLGSAPTGASGTGPIAITAYPGETVTITPDPTTTPYGTIYGVFSGVDSTYYVDGEGNPLYSQWITFSNLIITIGGTEDGPINLQVASSNWRVVNNDLAAPDSTTANAGGVAGNGTYDVVLGNHIHDIAGNQNLQDHGIYFDQGGLNYEVAYNVIENITGGNGIQTYDPDGNIFSNVNIHHNWIHDIAKHGINIANSSGPGYTVWDNVVYNTVRSCVRMISDNLSGAEIWNNTFYNCYTHGGDGAVTNDDSTPGISADFRNNIIWPSTNSGLYVGGDQGFTGDGLTFTFNKNLWFNGTDPGDVTILDANALFADPLFTNVGGTPPDFHLLSGSFAINSGDTTVSTLVNSNYDLTPLPSVSGSFDRGAY